MKILRKLMQMRITKLTLISLLVKTLFFLSLLSVFNMFLNVNFFMLIFYFTFIVILVSPAYFLKQRGAIIYCVTVNMLYSLILTADLWYYRANWNFLGLRLIIFKDFFNPFKGNIVNPNILDALFWTDILIILLMLFRKKITAKETPSYKHGFVSLSLSVVIIILYHFLIDVKDVTNGKLKLFQTDWAPHIVMSNLGPIGYHIYESQLTLQKVGIKEDSKAIEEINKWLLYNKETISDNEYKGIFKGKNLIFLQIESLENFVIGKSVYGQEITPNLNKMLNSSYYFSNFYEQNAAGNSIDCDMLVNTSTLPLLDSITFLTHAEVKYNSLPKVLKESGYYTVSTHAERGSDWNWGEAHSNGLGFNEQWDIGKYKIDELVGFGLSDRSFFTQFGDKLLTLKQPFYGVLPTLSNHGPFNIDNEYRKLKLPEKIDNNYLGGYFQSVHYTDEQIGAFIEKLKEDGLLKNTIVVIYGDHSGVHKYYNDYIQSMPLEGSWWRDYEKKVPLIIYSENLERKEFKTYGGHIDIMPTIAYLLGIDDSYYRDTVMGRVLVNTNRNATIIKGNEIKGYPLSEEEKEHLKSAYNIGEKIILNNYFKNRKLQYKD